MVVGCVLVWLWWPHAPATSEAKAEALEVKQAALTTSAGGAAAPVAVVSPVAVVDSKKKPGAAAIASFSWGSGAGALGRTRPQEGNPEAPMSVAVDARGTTYILDQPNGRVVKVARDGSPAGTFAVPMQAAQDLVVARDGTVAILDRLADKSIALVDAEGKPKGELHLLGKGMPEGGASSGLFADGDAVLVEREHGDTVRVGTTAGVNDPERPEFPGRPSRDGKMWLTAAISTAATGLVLVNVIDRPSLAHRFTVQVRPAQNVVSLLLLDADAKGVIYLAALAGTESSNYQVAVLCLDPVDGRTLGRVTLPANEGADETFRELTVGDDGVISYLHRTEQGAELLRATCP